MSANQPSKFTMRVLWLLLLFAYGVSSICCSIPDDSTDKISLLDFKRAVTNDPTQVFRSWNTSIPHCQWKGVYCSKTDLGRVTMLNLGGLGLTGTISPSIGNLSFLRALNLSTNSFSGELPPLNRLHKLQDITLRKNSLQGTVPEAITNCSNLMNLDLSGNFLKGEIPHNIGLLSTLGVIQLSENNLTGTIPLSIRNISQLIALNLANNQLTGSIPNEIGQLSNLLALVLGGNKLSGGIPEVLFNLSSLRGLDLSINTIGKDLPSYFGDNLPDLVLLSLNDNMFEGHIPPSLGNASKLISIDLSSNNFVGLIPNSFGNLGMLNFLNLGQNKLEARDRRSWEFIDTLSNCSSLQQLFLGENQLHGVIPDSIGNLSAIQQLKLDKNNLSGTIPRTMGSLIGLITLGLSNNNLRGPIGEWIGKLQNLQGLALHTNKFSGPIPLSIGNLTELALLSLAQNEFQGLIPPSLGNLPRLLELNLSYNNLQGSIPKEIFRATSTMIKCILSYNKLEGSIPPEISNLKQLTELYLSSNELTGEISSTLGNFEGLNVMRMDNNFLTGNIPKSFGHLKSLGTLNLSRNNLSGFIPVELGHLQFLTGLDVSYNNLQGQIPKDGVFGNAKALSLLGNRGLCGGVSDLHMPSCPTVSHKREIQYYLVRSLIPIFGFLSLITLVYFLITEKMGRRAHLSLSPFGEQFLKVSYTDLSQATKNFSESNLIGRGSHGSVYKGQLIEGKLEVAVKVLDLDMRGAEKSFLSECEALRSIQHRNLVHIITACSTVDIQGNLFKALVYEFMPNGNLDTWLHHTGAGKAPKRLGLTQRINIAVNIADALDYLHNDSGRPIIHCDVKPSNILLDDDMTAHLGDFGIARFYLDSSSTPVGDSNPTISIGVKGTIGYIAPEYAGGGRTSTCGDVYSFGIVLLEMMTSKRPTHPIFENGLNIVNFVERSLPDQILHVIDAALQEECKPFNQATATAESKVYLCLFSLLEVALSCTRQLPSERITMREAANKMHAIKASYVGGKDKNASLKGNTTC